MLNAKNHLLQIRVLTRCSTTTRLLESVRVARPGVEIEIIEILEHPLRVLRDHVKIIPLIVINDRRWYQAPSEQEILAVLDADG